jgi:hypothetical protein
MHYFHLLAMGLPDSNTIILLVGCFLLIIGILGGGIEVKELRIPAINPLPRIIAGVAGVVLVAISLGALSSYVRPTGAVTPPVISTDLKTIDDNATGAGAKPVPPPPHAASPAKHMDTSSNGAINDIPYDKIHRPPATHVLPYFMTRELTTADMDGKSYLELDEMKNEIFARHGRKFQDPKIQAYFATQKWYSPLYEPQNFPVSVLTQVQRKNVEILIHREKELQ